MNIKIADRLIKLRKEKGLSQEELASKLGLSRQAVSKWERAEASPDTDNLICLAKLYGVSLDELLQDDDDIETIVKEQIKANNLEDDEDGNDTAKSKTTNVHFSDNGINIQDGDDKVHVSFDGVHVVDKDSEIHIGKDGIHVISDGDTIHVGKKSAIKFSLVNSLVFGISSFLALLALILLGIFIPGGWGWSWTFFLLVPVISCMPIVIKKKKASAFPYPVLVTFVYLFVCLAIVPIWHPLWVVFLTIPVYYSIVDPIEKYIRLKNETIEE